MAQVRQQLLLGDEAFIERHKASLAKEPLREVSKAQRRAIAMPLEEYQVRYKDKDEAMARAYLSGAYTMAMIAEQFRVHYMTVSRAVRKAERGELRT
jgi:putative transposase